MKRLRKFFFALAASVAFANCIGGLAQAAEEGVSYVNDVFPIFEKYCIACHTVDDPSGKLVMESFDQLMNGGEHGTVITPGVPDSSRLFLMAAGKMDPVMPPDDMEGPSSDELEILRQWIEEGAVGPDKGSMIRRSLNTPKIAPAEASLAPITALTLTPDGKQLVAARFGSLQVLDATAALADSASGESLIAEFPGKINDLRFSADGQKLVIATGVTGLYGRVVVFDWNGKKTLREIDGHRDTLYAAAISPDGKLIASGGYDRDIMLWNAETGELVRTLKGHNGAIFDLQFSTDGKVLASASADETVKLWRVTDGERLDTLSQPQGEVWSVTFSPDGKFIAAASSDNRFRIWKFESQETPQINTLVETRFADESPLVDLAFTGNGQHLVVASQSGRIGLFETQRWTKLGDLANLNDVISSLRVSPSGDVIHVAMMNGELQHVEAKLEAMQASATQSTVKELFLQIDSITELKEQDTAHQTAQTAMALPRGAKVSGVIKNTEAGQAEVDCYKFFARQGEVWMVETNAARSGSPLDTRVEVLEASGEPIVRARLQAIRDSYFTFRGKDSAQSNDFRLFAWEEMELNDLLYSSGEVTKLWMYPRGPDSGFNVYPGTGSRHTYFDTNPVTHALQEPAYVVRELGADEPPIANGLPVFTVYYANDDDAQQKMRTDSQLKFIAPYDGDFVVNVTDSRGMAGDNYKYDLTVRPAAPDYKAFVDKIGKPIPAGAGREFRVRVERIDGFQGPVIFELTGLPEGLHATTSVIVEADQHEAYGVVWADSDVAIDKEFGEPQVIARGEILGRVVEHRVGGLGVLKTSAKPQVRLWIAGGSEPVDYETNEPTRLSVKAGQTISAMIHVERNGLDGEIKLGNEFSGRNMPHGVFVDNIGLNGLMILKGSNQHQFFVTAAPIAAAGERLFHLKAEVDGGITSKPVILDVQP